MPQILEGRGEEKMRARNPRDEERVIDGMDRVPSLKQHLIERAMLCTCAIFFFWGGEWGCREFGRWCFRSYFFWTFSGSHFARSMSSDGAEKQLTAEVTISYCVQLWVDRYVIQWQLRIMNNNKIIKLGIQYFDIHFMLIIIILIWFSKQPKPSKHHFCSKNDNFHQHHFMNQVIAFLLQ